MKEYIEREAVIEWVESWLNMDRYYHPNGKHNNIPITELCALLKQIPAADVVDGEAYRKLLKASRKMHCWIFLNAADELEAYDECGLTDEMNALLGYGGKFTVKMDGGVDE